MYKLPYQNHTNQPQSHLHFHHADAIPTLHVTPIRNTRGSVV